RSNGDRFEKNQVGCGVIGATGDSTAVSFNTATFEAHGSAFINSANPAAANSGGVLVFGLDFSGLESSSGNIANVALWDCTVSDNQKYDLRVFGARSTATPSRVPGADN